MQKRRFYSRRPVSCHGLMKHGATSCLNSVLQVLFMTREFREAVNRFVDDNPKSEFIDPSLKTLFDDLLHQPADPHEIIKTLGIDKANEEQDAAECLEKILGLTSPKAAQIFYGQMAQRITCCVCRTSDDNNESFWHLPLELVDSCSGNYSVEEGIEKFFRVSYFRGEAQAHCEPCDAKVDFTRQNIIKEHPDVLILQLKRFDSSSGLMPLIKLNCAVSAPCILETPDNQTYELYAVVDHFDGYTDGHYIAVIKSHEERWNSFDDSTVSSLNRSPFADNRNVARLRNACLLFYKKRPKEKTEVCTNESDEYFERYDDELTLYTAESLETEQSADVDPSEPFLSEEQKHTTEGGCGETRLEANQSELHR